MNRLPIVMFTLVSAFTLLGFKSWADTLICKNSYRADVRFKIDFDHHNVSTIGTGIREGNVFATENIISDSGDFLFDPRYGKKIRKTSTPTGELLFWSQTLNGKGYIVGRYNGYLFNSSVVDLVCE